MVAADQAGRRGGRRRPLRRRPVPLALERVGRQRHLMRAAAGVERRPVDGHTRDVRPAEERGERLAPPAHPPAAPPRRRRRHVDALPGHRGQHRVRTQLQEPGHPLLGRARGSRRRTAPAAARAPPSTPGRSTRPSTSCAGHVRDHRDPRLLERQPLRRPRGTPPASAPSAASGTRDSPAAASSSGPRTAATTRPTASTSPDTTTAGGPFTAATDNRPANARPARGDLVLGRLHRDHRPTRPATPPSTGPAPPPTRTHPPATTPRPHAPPPSHRSNARPGSPAAPQRLAPAGTAPPRPRTTPAA